MFWKRKITERKNNTIIAAIKFVLRNSSLAPCLTQLCVEKNHEKRLKGLFGVCGGITCFLAPSTLYNAALVMDFPLVAAADRGAAAAAAERSAWNQRLPLDAADLGRLVGCWRRSRLFHIKLFFKKDPPLPSFFFLQPWHHPHHQQHHHPTGWMMNAWCSAEDLTVTRAASPRSAREKPTVQVRG